MHSYQFTALPQIALTGCMDRLSLSWSNGKGPTGEGRERAKVDNARGRLCVRLYVSSFSAHAKIGNVIIIIIIIIRVVVLGLIPEQATD